MADRVVFISWGQVVRGREERAMENFNETIGLYGKMPRISSGSWPARR